MISIDDADVSAVAQLLGCTFEAPHTAFLKKQHGCQLHACPGSGKTTLLVAKLALLAQRWPWRDRGILVLSHTNVARREVESRLGKHPGAARLLGYPHYIGTIQGFVDRFLAMPYLLDVGVRGAPVPTPRVDDEAFERRAKQLILDNAGWAAYRTAKLWLNNQHEAGAPIVRSLHYSGAELAIATAATSKLPSESSPTGIQLRALKDKIAREGIFRFVDMFAFAAASLKHRPLIRSALRRRFPWVFVDEMQDTSREQADLLDDLFGATVAFTRIGDPNQAIYAETEGAAGADVPWATQIELPQSQRLAPRLAKLVTPLAVVHPLELEGSVRRRDRAHTIFAFDEASIERVLPAFGDLILEQWEGTVSKGFVAKAVGGRRSPLTTPKLPGRLADYWPQFEPPTARSSLQATLLAAVRHAQQLVVEEREFFRAYATAHTAIARLLELHENAPVRRMELDQRCRDGQLPGDDLRRAIWHLLRTDCTSTANTWTAEVKTLLKLLSISTARPIAAGYLAWEEPGSQVVRRPACQVYLHSNGGGSVPIEVTTIHAVKGETHDATLVLETYFRSHDLKTALPHLARKTIRKPSASTLNHMKKLFVATTRPTELLCLAVHRSHLTDGLQAALAATGWNIRQLG